MLILLLSCISSIETLDPSGSESGFVVNNSSPATYVEIRARDVDERLIGEGGIDLPPYSTISIVIPDDTWILTLYTESGEPDPYDVHDLDALVIQ